MKFKGTLEIKKSLQLVTELFIDPTYMGEYQDGFVRKELVSGSPGEVGTISNLYYSQNGRDLELTETITSNELPHSFEASYHHIHMDNTMKCNFTELDENKTRYDYEFEYTRINWIMPRLMAILFPGVYRRQGEKWMVNFKNFVENYE